MQKIKSIRKGRVWLNVYRAADGELTVTIQKSYPAKEGGYRQTQFLRPEENDLRNIAFLLTAFSEFQSELAQEGWSK